MNQTASISTVAIFKKLTYLEEQMQSLKVQAYLNLPKSEQIGLYPQEAINKALKSSRKQIWRKTYAKKIKGFS